MNLERKILYLVGGIFLVVGLTITLTFSFVFGFPESLFPTIFVIIGAGLCAIPTIVILKEKKAWREGTPYTGKVYGYVEDRSMLVNGAYPLNVKVRYFDEMHQVREAILATRFTSGSQMYAIGTTIDIREYKGKFFGNPKTVRHEILANEELLMENRPLDMTGIVYAAVTCESCGASFKAPVGYATKCPYCDSYTKA